VSDQGVIVNGSLIPNTRPLSKDLMGRQLPCYRISNYQMQADEVFLISDLNPIPLTPVILDQSKSGKFAAPFDRFGPGKMVCSDCFLTFGCCRVSYPAVYSGYSCSGWLLVIAANNSVPLANRFKLMRPRPKLQSTLGRVIPISLSRGCSRPTLIRFLIETQSRESLELAFPPSEVHS